MGVLEETETSCLDVDYRNFTKVGKSYKKGIMARSFFQLNTIDKYDFHCSPVILKP